MTPIRPYRPSFSSETFLFTVLFMYIRIGFGAKIERRSRTVSGLKCLYGCTADSGTSEDLHRSRHATVLSGDAGKFIA
jgi:hypothetical protein